MHIKVLIDKTDNELNIKINKFGKRFDASLLTAIKRKFHKRPIDFYAEHNEVNHCPFCNGISKYKTIISKIDDSTYKISFEENRNKYGDIMYPCLDNKKCVSNLNPNSFEYISKALNISLDEAVAYLHKHNKSPFYRENHESDEDYSKFQTRDEEWYIKKYGEECGKKKFNEIIEKSKISSTKDYIIEHKGLEYYLDWKKRRSTCTESHWIEKYGEEIGKEKYKEHLKKVTSTEERFINLYNLEEGHRHLIKFINHKKYLTSGDYYKDKYGEEDGKKIWNNIKKKYSYTKKEYIKNYGEEAWDDAIRIRCERTTISKESNDAFLELIDEISSKHKICDIEFGINEFGLFDKKNGKYYSYDFKANIDGKDYIIEYDTPFLHPSKKYMSIDEYNNWENVFDINQTPEEKEDFDERKKDFAKKSGFEVFTFYVNKNRDIDKNIKEFLDFIKC